MTKVLKLNVRALNKTKQKQKKTKQNVSLFNVNHQLKIIVSVLPQTKSINIAISVFSPFYCSMSSHPLHSSKPIKIQQKLRLFT